jgi:hypothetical protein
MVEKVREKLEVGQPAGPCPRDPFASTRTSMVPCCPGHG